MESICSAGGHAGSDELLEESFLCSGSEHGTTNLEGPSIRSLHQEMGEFDRLVRYTLEDPVKANLCEDWNEWS